jgi:putative phage-type endonuclease
MTAVLLCPPGTDEADWLKARQAGIGASEIAAVLGISPYASPFSLYWSKVNGWEIEDTGDMEAGRRMESAIADWAADRIDPNEQLIIVPAGLYQSAERPWELATPDRLVYLQCETCVGAGRYPGGLQNCPDCLGDGAGNLTGGSKLVAVLECKHPYSWDGFGEDGTDEIPVYFRTQLLQQMDVMEVGEGYLAAYCGHELRVYHLRRDDRDIAVMRAAGGAFWQRLQDGIVPGVDEHQATAVALRRLHPTVEDFDVQVPVDLAEGYRRARALKARAAAVVDRYEARIRVAIGDGRRAMCGKQLVASRSVYDQSGDTAELGALDGDWPTVNRLNPGRSASYV